MKKAKLFGCALMMAVAATQLVAAPKAQVYDQIIRLPDLNDRVIQDSIRGIWVILSLNAQQDPVCHSSSR